MEIIHHGSKYLFLVFSLLVIAWGINTVISAIGLYRGIGSYTAFYFFIPLTVATSIYYLHFFFPKYKDRLRTAKPLLIFIALCSGLYWVAITGTITPSGTNGISGNSLAWHHWFSGLYFHIFLPLAGLIGLLIRRKIGWILLLVYPCYMIYYFIDRIHLWLPVYYFNQFLSLYPFFVYCVILPVICCLPVMRNYFRIRSVKEGLICLGIAAVIGLSLAIHWHEYVRPGIPPGMPKTQTSRNM